MTGAFFEASYSASMPSAAAREKPQGALIVWHLNQRLSRSSRSTHLRSRAAFRA